MNTSLKKVIWIILCGVLVLTIVSALIQSRRAKSMEQELADTRLALRKQGFKTDPADFDVVTDSAMRTRIGALMVFWDSPPSGRAAEHLDLLPVMANDTATVIWKQDWLKTATDPVQWADLHDLLDTNREPLDAACNAALSGPIRFDMDVNSENGVWEIHLPALRQLMLALSDRVMLELHEGNPDAAWTNLLAATRLVTVWEPEPPPMAHLRQYGLVNAVFADTWQALQNGSWPDARLAVLQQEWESANYFTNLPEADAFACAMTLNDFYGLTRQSPFEDFHFSDFAKEAVQEPSNAYREIHDDIARIRYRGGLEFADEKRVLLYFHNRQQELRHAIQSPTWKEMRALPGVTNAVPIKFFWEEENGLMEVYQNLNLSLLAQTAEMEARRRILITAIALERYRGKHGAYPATLASLAPEFLKTVPMDFMDGQPLRYRLTNDGHFVLYSVGLDCVDDGGKFPLLHTPRMPNLSEGSLVIPTNMDLVWPCPAAP